MALVALFIFQLNIMGHNGTIKICWFVEMWFCFDKLLFGFVDPIRRPNHSYVQGLTKRLRRTSTRTCIISMTTIIWFGQGYLENIWCQKWHHWWGVSEKGRGHMMRIRMHGCGRQHYQPPTGFPSLLLPWTTSTATFWIDRMRVQHSWT